MAARDALIVTGDDVIDRRLAALEPKLQRKYIKKATREVAKIAREKMRQATPRYTGAMADAMQVRAVTRNVKMDAGIVKSAFSKRAGRVLTFSVKKVVAKHFGAKVEITRKSLAKQLSRHGKSQDAEEVTSGERFFYPAAVELGTREESADKPMRRTVKQMQPTVVGLFLPYLRGILNDAK